MVNKVLIVEDEPILLRALNVELLSQGFEVISAKDGEAALRLIKEENPQLILLDLIMPKKNGFEVLKEIKNDDQTKRIPVIVLTNLGQEKDKKEVFDLGAEDYFVKASTDLNELSKKIEKILNKESVS